MTEGLRRFYGGNDLHFLTFSCYRRRPLFRNEAYCDLFLKILERVRRRYRLVVLGYVVMPEHIHLLVSEPQRETLSTAIQALKLGFVRSLQFSGSGGVVAPQFRAPLCILNDSGRRGFMISMFGRRRNESRSCDISIGIR
jgi:REP element-mobilizing transposase RayT